MVESLEQTKWVCFEPTVWPGACCSAERIRVVSKDKTYLTELVRDVRPLWYQRDKNYHNRDLKPKLCDGSLLPSIRKLDDIQILELRTEFLISVTRKIQITKNLSLPFNSVPTASNSSCIPSLSHATSLDSTHSRDSDTSNTYTADFLHLKRGFTATSVSSSILRIYEGLSQRRKIVYQFRLHSSILCEK
jgi:hypothetical protein